MAGQVHIVPHFHWDREWYFTAEESRILLVHDLEEVMDLLEAREDYPCFVLDGQTAVLEDYLAVKPENRKRLKKLVQAGRLIIGPWYTQMDEMVVGGESIVRNLLYGFADCAEFGPPMMIGYLPDSFGQSARMPQILNGFGIRRSMFWRGTSERMGTDKTEFLWRDEDGSQVTVQLLPLGYAIGKYLPVEPDALADRMEKYLPVLDRGATTDHILLPNGHDQMPVQKNIWAVMESLKALYPDRDFFLDRYESVFDQVERNGGLDVLTGEFLDGKYMRVHRSIYSSRSDLKSANTRIENKITNCLEPLASIAASLGFPYEHGLMENIWKELMKNHAHDSIGCCCSDKVHRAIGDRFFLAEERADRLTEYYMRIIVDSMSCRQSLDKLTVFNFLPCERTGVFRGEIVTKMKNFDLVRPDGGTVPYVLVGKEVVDAGLIDRQIVHYGDYDPFLRYTVLVKDTIPAMGYQTYLVQETGGEHPAASAKQDCPTLENRFYSIRVEENGTLTIYDKEKGMTHRDVLLVEDGGDDGDEYDYSALEPDLVLTSRNVRASIAVTDRELEREALIRFSMPIPRDLVSRRKGELDTELSMEFSVILREDARTIEVRAACDNRSRDHRVRLLVPCGPSEHSLADNQFGRILRPARDPAMDHWEEERWSERPDAIYPFLSYVTGQEGNGMSVITNSVREYEIIGEDTDTLAITLFRSVGVLGKEGLTRRPGRPSGIRMETPDAQMEGIQTFSLFLTTEKEHLAALAKETLTPLLTYNKMPYHAMKLNPSGIETPYSYSLLKMEGGAVLSALKEAEDGGGFILRAFNPTEDPVTVHLSGRCARLREANLREAVIGLPESDAVIAVNQVKTFLLE